MTLEEFPSILRKSLESFPLDLLRRRSAAGLFAPVEQAWHIADLEVEGYGARIDQLLREAGAYFADFNGEEVATRRRYIELDLEPALQRFESARAANVARLKEKTANTATQAGVMGVVTLERIAEMMAAHDGSHMAEIDELRREAKL